MDNNHVKADEPARRYSGASISRRKCSRQCFLPSTESVHVCQIMFLNTLGFTTDSCIETALTNAQTDIVAPSMRGLNPKSHKIPEEDDTFIKNHIKSFNPTLPHYRREHAPNRLYLSDEISITEMYSDYCHECEMKNMKNMKDLSNWV